MVEVLVISEAKRKVSLICKFFNGRCSDCPLEKCLIDNNTTLGTLEDIDEIYSQLCHRGFFGGELK